MQEKREARGNLHQDVLGDDAGSPLKIHAGQELERSVGRHVCNLMDTEAAQAYGAGDGVEPPAAALGAKGLRTKLLQVLG